MICKCYLQCVTCLHPPAAAGEAERFHITAMAPVGAARGNDISPPPHSPTTAAQAFKNLACPSPSAVSSDVTPAIAWVPRSLLRLDLMGCEAAAKGGREGGDGGMTISQLFISIFFPPLHYFGISFLWWVHRNTTPKCLFPFFLVSSFDRHLRYFQPQLYCSRNAVGWEIFSLGNLRSVDAGSNFFWVIYIVYLIYFIHCDFSRYTVGFLSLFLFIHRFISWVRRRRRCHCMSETESILNWDDCRIEVICHLDFCAMCCNDMKSHTRCKKRNQRVESTLILIKSCFFIA